MFEFVHKHGKLVCMHRFSWRDGSRQFVRDKSPVKKEYDEKILRFLFYCCVFAPPGGFC